VQQARGTEYKLPLHTTKIVPKLQCILFCMGMLLYYKLNRTGKEVIMVRRFKSPLMICNEICTLLELYAAQKGNSVPTLWDNL